MVQGPVLAGSPARSGRVRIVRTEHGRRGNGGFNRANPRGRLVPLDQSHPPRTPEQPVPESHGAGETAHGPLDSGPVLRPEVVRQTWILEREVTERRDDPGAFHHRRGTGPRRPPSAPARSTTTRSTTFPSTTVAGCDESSGSTSRSGCTSCERCVPTSTTPMRARWSTPHHRSDPVAALPQRGPARRSTAGRTGRLRAGNALCCGELDLDGRGRWRRMTRRPDDRRTTHEHPDGVPARQGSASC